MATIIIPARYGSTRFPAKVLADLNGKPLFAWVAIACLKTKADRVIVVTDHQKVLDACKTLVGISAIMSSPDIATGSDRVAFVASDLADDIIINVQGDEPFIPHTLIDELIDTLAKNRDIQMASAMVEITDKNLLDSPSAVKVVCDQNNFALYFSRHSIPYNRDKIDTVKHYKHIGVYAYRRTFLLSLNKLERTPLEIAENLEQLRALETGQKIKMILTDYNPISVDTKEDLDIAVKYHRMKYINN